MRRFFRPGDAFSRLLNLAGMGTAFAVFLLLMSEVLYVHGYDRFPGSDRIFRVELRDPEAPEYSAVFSRPMIARFRELAPAIEASAIYNGPYRETVSLPEAPERTHSVEFAEVEPGILDVFPFEWVAGNPEDFRQPYASVISESAAKRLFPGEMPVGRMYRMTGGAESRIVAVYRDFPLNSQVSHGMLWNMGNRSLDDPSEWSYRLLTVVDPAQADGTALLLESVLDDLKLQYGVSVEERFFRLQPLREMHYDMRDGGTIGRPMVVTLFTIAWLILGIAVVNFFNFAMASVPFRIRTFNTGRILGRTRAAVICGELFLGALTGLLAYLLALVLFRAVSGTFVASLLSTSLAFADNLPLLSAGAVLAVLTGCLGSWYPAVYSTSFPPAMVVQGSFSLSASGRRLRSVLIGFQYVFSFLLVIVSAYIAVQIDWMERYDMGFSREQVLTFRVSSKTGQRADALENELKKNPRILDVTFAGNNLVSNGFMGWGREYEGTHVQLNCLPVASDFITFFGMEMEEGRNFQPSDDRHPNGTFILNRATMDLYPQLKLNARLTGHAPEPAEIVGIVRNFHFKPLQYGIEPMALYVFGSDPWWPLTFVYVKVAPEDLKGTIDFIRKTAEGMDPDNAVFSVRFLDEAIGNLYERERNLYRLMTVSTLVALGIALIGILGLVYFETQFRRREIALRRVCGASVRTILQMLNGYYLRIVLVCFVLSAPLAFWAIRFWSAQFAYRAPVPVWIFLAALLLLLLLTAAIVTLRSRHTATSNPTESLSNQQ